MDAPEQSQQQQTPQKPQFQNGVRTNGRAFNSPNWRMKREESPSGAGSRTPSQDQTESPRRTPGFGRQREVPAAISEGRRLYVGNMPYTAKMEDVSALFTKGGFEVSRIDISVDPFSGRNPSYCFVDLNTKELAERAMAELDGSDLLGRPVKIKPGVVKSASERQQQQQQRTGLGMGMGGLGASDGSSSGSPRANRTGSSPFNADRWRRDENSSSTTTTPTKPSALNFGTNSNSTNSNSDPSKRLYVGNLPRLTDQDALAINIKGFFKDFTVTNVSKLFTPHPAKRFEPGDHYYLFVDFETVEETQNAMAALNGAEGPWGNPIRVQRARGETWKSGENGSEERRPGARWGPSTRRQDAPAPAPAAAGETAVEA
ncbi:uncharacterized protein DSM5745_04032 [Aspergillus mulundensis]|uniref:RRM domain-containing protein n=1 Tax=Aspergillus mulundensis TaxID=1810919 RepID=A0A3D8SBL4_9EURO|nr:hypothetical protein DSM5745_04032 [Aspergillus mulundensis]RDW83706.1 hypothetical protein DSM5745_04032 [Aspergillus mulundensis]